MLCLRAITIVTLVLAAPACATLPPPGAPRGELVVVSNTGDAHVKVIELQHQDYTHAESISGFERGQQTLRKEVIAGHYCVERMLFDTGPAGSGVLPPNLCFDVAAGEPTEIHVLVSPAGGIGIAVQHSNPLEDPGLPIAGPD